VAIWDPVTQPIEAAAGAVADFLESLPDIIGNTLLAGAGLALVVLGARRMFAGSLPSSGR